MGKQLKKQFCDVSPVKEGTILPFPSEGLEKSLGELGAGSTDTFSSAESAAREEKVLTNPTFSGKRRKKARFVPKDPVLKSKKLLSKSKIEAVEEDLNPKNELEEPTNVIKASYKNISKLEEMTRRLRFYLDDIFLHNNF